MADKRVQDGSTQPSLVQFMHPGPEFEVQGCMTIGKSVPVAWRKTDGASLHSDHCRRLVRHHGQFVADLNGEPKEEVFCLDTVFVVEGDGIDYTYSTINGIDCSEAYKNLSLRRVDKAAKNTFYRGVRYGTGREIFSFTPAKRVGDKEFSRRCVIEDVKTLNQPGVKVFAQGRTQGFCSQIVEDETIRQAWRKIVDQVRAQGFVLGVGFDWPVQGVTR